MTPENEKRIQEAVKEAGLSLVGKLSPGPHRRVRNPYAHLWDRIKYEMGKSYKECNDDQVGDILDIVNYYRNNPC